MVISSKVNTYTSICMLAFLIQLLFIFDLKAQEGNPDFTMNDVNKIFEIHQPHEDGFILSKCIDKGPVLTDYEVFIPGSIIIVELWKKFKNEKQINTPIGPLVNGEIYFIDKNRKPVTVTKKYQLPYKNAAGVQYWVPDKPNDSMKPKNQGFNIWNWIGEVSYSIGQDGTMVIGEAKKR